MEFASISPHIRFVNIFSYYPKEADFVKGYDYRLFYITDKSIFLKFKDVDHILESNTLVIIPPDVPYKLMPTGDTDCEILCFNFDLVKCDTSDSSVHPEPESDFCADRVFEKNRIPEFEKAFVIPNAVAYLGLLTEIYDEFRTKKFGYREKGEAMLCSVLVSCIRYNMGNKKEAKLSAMVKEYILSHLTEGCSAQEIGESLHYHPNYINRVFKENCGTTIHSYLLQKRIEMSKQLLVTSSLSIEKISARCGFKTSAHFSMSFRSICGMTPGEYRRSSENIII